MARRKAVPDEVKSLPEYGRLQALGLVDQLVVRAKEFEGKLLEMGFGRADSRDNGIQCALDEIFPERLRGVVPEESKAEEVERVADVEEGREAGVGGSGGGEAAGEGFSKAPAVGAEGEGEVVVEGKGGRRLTMRRAVEWVFDALGREGLTEGDAPSPGAWSMWCWATASAGNRSEFYRSFAVKLLPSRTQIEAEGDGDDGGEIAERVLAKLFPGELLAEGAGGSEGEPSVESEHGETGAA
jgi:hypothetical protein